MHKILYDHQWQKQITRILKHQIGLLLMKNINDCQLNQKKISSHELLFFWLAENPTFKSALARLRAASNSSRISGNIPYKNEKSSCWSGRE
jgi:hypothetical protein